MRRKISRLTLLILPLMVAACGGFVSHRVQPGDTLYSISWRYGLDYRAVAGWNDLKPPYTVRNGQVLRIVPPAAHEPEAIDTAQSPQPAPVLTAPSASSSPPARTPFVYGTAPVKWQWPAQGNLKQTFSDSDMSRKGIDIGGKLGQAVVAAAAGQVVYAGSGLAHYGKLIILKHNDNYLSAYAYNRVLLVHEGDAVAGGQHIADMGSKGKDDALLHFEIRYDGRPINPLQFLPEPRP